MGKYYPIMLDINKKLCKVIGGGKVAERKISSLLEAGATVEVISPIITEELSEYVKDKRIIYNKRKYKYGDLKGSFLVYATTDDKEINALCLKECKENEILINAVDIPQMCDFIVPANITRGDLSISISTNGNSPMLSKKIKKELEEKYTEIYVEYIEILGELRNKIKKEVNDINSRREIFRKLIYSETIDKYINGEVTDLKKSLYKIYYDNK